MTERTVALDEPATRNRDNPYVGPRPFRANELFFGREREATALVNTVLSGRVVLLHSPSGAGKTSLIQTSLVPAFERRKFQICTATGPDFSALRLNLPPPPDVEVPNRYVFSFVNGLVGHLVERSTALTMTVLDALECYRGGSDANQKQLVVIDQMEEILTLDPGDVGGQRGFFKQLGDALDLGRRWALLAMREDYMGGLDRFLGYLPGQLRSTFRLDLLDEQAALRAVKDPPRTRGVTFHDEAAQILVTDLRRARAEAVDDLAGPVSSPYVEPVLLQVVCESLWRRQRQRQGNRLEVITADDVAELRPFSKALSTYYRAVVREAAGTDVDTDTTANRAIRDWIEEHLVSKQSLRRPTLSMPKVDDPAATVRALQDRYLIRDDPRPGGTWWELSHDMLIAPILEDNRAWRVGNLKDWQVKAHDWQRAHDERYLLHGADYRAARSESKKIGVTDVEKKFLEASRQAVAVEDRKGQLEALVNFLVLWLVVSLALNVLLFYLWKFR